MALAVISAFDFKCIFCMTRDRFVLIVFTLSPSSLPIWETPIREPIDGRFEALVSISVHEGTSRVLDRAPIPVIRPAGR
jgi:hypothetical protein